MIRLVADSGGIIHGGLAQVGSVGVTCARRSCTSCRASQLVGAALEDELGSTRAATTDLERSSSRPVDPVELLLDRDGDQLLDLVRGVAERDRLDLDLRRGELGEDVDLRVRDLRDAEDHQRRGGEEHQPPEPQASRDDPTHYRYPPCLQWLPRSRTRCRTPRRPRPSRPRCRRAGRRTARRGRRRCGRPRPAPAGTSAASGSCRRTSCPRRRRSAPRRG